MSWISPWALFLGGIESSIYNATYKLKEPFRLILKEKYAEMYNERDLFKKISSCPNNIILRSRHWSHMSGGNDLFLIHLINEYQHQNKKVKIIMFGNQGNTADYFAKHFDYTVTDLDGRNTKYRESFTSHLNEFNNVISVRTNLSYSEEYKSKPSIIPKMVEEIAKREEDNVIYLITNLFVDKNDEESISTLSTAPHVKLVYFENDFPNFRLNHDSINIFFPHYENDLNKNDFKRLVEAFPSVPTKMLEKYYYPYNHFIYEWNGKSGLFFMKNVLKD